MGIVLCGGFFIHPRSHIMIQCGMFGMYGHRKLALYTLQLCQYRDRKSPYQLIIFSITVVMVGFDPTMYTVSEGGVVSFTIRRLTATTRTVSVIFNTVGNTAIGAHITSPTYFLLISLTRYCPSLRYVLSHNPQVPCFTTSLPPALTFPPSPAAPGDYGAVLNRMVTFGPSDNTQTVDVMVNTDSIAEAAELFLGRLSLPSGSSGVAISGGDATATISDTNGE